MQATLSSSGASVVYVSPPTPLLPPAQPAPPPSAPQQQQPATLLVQPAQAVGTIPVLMVQSPPPVAPSQPLVAPPPPPQQQAEALPLSSSVTGQKKGLEGVPSNFFDDVPERDRTLLERVFEAMSQLHEADQDHPTELGLQHARCADPTRGTLWYNCISYGYLKPITLAQQLQLSQMFGSMTRELHIGLYLQGMRQQSRGGLILQIWSHQQHEQIALQQAMLQSSGNGHTNGKRVRMAEGIWATFKDTLSGMVSNSQ